MGKTQLFLFSDPPRRWFYFDYDPGPFFCVHLQVFKMCIRDRCDPESRFHSVVRGRAARRRRHFDHWRTLQRAGSVSYTHLDVYKRQGQGFGPTAAAKAAAQGTPYSKSEVYKQLLVLQQGQQAGE